MSLFITSYHSIIVSRKNISYSGLFIYLGFLSYVIIHHFVSQYHRITKKYILLRAFHIPRIFILFHHFSLRIIVSRKNISYILRAFHIPRVFILCHYSSLRIIVSSYHEKIYLTQGFSYTSDFYIISSFFTSYHRITKKYILLMAIQIPRIFIYLYIMNI